MRYRDMMQKSDKELDSLLNENITQLAKMAIDMKTKQVSNVRQIRALKKDIARALTLKQDRVYASQEESNG